MRAAPALFICGSLLAGAGGGLRKAGEEQVDHAASVVVGVGLDADAQVANAAQELLRRHRNWTRQRYHTWLAEAVTDQLLAAP